jgi:GNAT superfamily N-acetyltransferase
MSQQPINITIREANNTADYAMAAQLFREYAASLDFDLGFQDFEDELHHLQAHYGPPKGCILLAIAAEQPAGCIAIRPFSETQAELKRMFVQPAFRGQSIGRKLLREIFAKAAQAGYRSILLDTVPAMEDAIHLYRQTGFADIAPYRFNPIPGALFMEAIIPAR